MTSDTPLWGSAGPAEEAGPFYLIVEQNTGSTGSTIWQCDPTPARVAGSRDVARAKALELAKSFSPRHPLAEQDRTIYRVNPDVLIVVVQGATKAFHFRVSVGEVVG